MASTTAFQVTHGQDMACGIAGLSPESAATASRILQENHEKHDIIFTDGGLHSEFRDAETRRCTSHGNIDHIAHHVLTAYALNATPERLQEQYMRNASYQRGPRPTQHLRAESFRNRSTLLSSLGQSTKDYPNYLLYFASEIEAKGCEAVCQEYLFQNDELANTMFARLFAGRLVDILITDVELKKM